MILIDQLKDIHVDGTLNPIDTTQWYPTVMRKDYALAFTVTETGLDDPDQMFYENYLFGSERNYTGWLNLVALDIDLDQRQCSDLFEQETVGIDQEMVVVPRYARRDACR